MFILQGSKKIIKKSTKDGRHLQVAQTGQ